MKQLNQREKLFLTGGGIALIVLIVIGGLVLPYRSAMFRVEKSIASHRQQLQNVMQLRQKYLDLKVQVERLQRDLQSDRVVAPLTFLEETAVNTAGRENLVLMRPLPSVVQDSARIESVEFKLERISLDQALQILWAMETARPPMRVDKLFIKQRFDDAKQLDMNVTVSAVRRN